MHEEKRVARILSGYLGSWSASAFVFISPGNIYIFPPLTPPSFPLFNFTTRATTGRPQSGRLRTVRHIKQTSALWRWKARIAQQFNLHSNSERGAENAREESAENAVYGSPRRFPSSSGKEKERKGGGRVQRGRSQGRRSGAESSSGTNQQGGRQTSKRTHRIT